MNKVFRFLPLLMISLVSCGGRTAPKTAVEDSLKIDEVATLEEETLPSDTVVEEIGEHALKPSSSDSTLSKDRGLTPGDTLQIN